MIRVTLDAALDPLTELLGVLRQCPHERRAFVIVQDLVTGRFVQFSGSSSEPLWFDAPQLGILNTGPKFEKPAVAAAYAIEQLRGPHRLPDCAELAITFDTSQEEQLS